MAAERSRVIWIGMFRRISLAIYRWLALRSFPDGAPQASYVFIDYVVPYGGLHERVMLYDKNGCYVLHFKSTNPLSLKDTTVRTIVAPEEAANLFLWLRERFRNNETMFLTKVRSDPARLTLFAFDAATTWKCSVCIYDIKVYEQLLNIRGEIVERVKRMASNIDVV